MLTALRRRYRARHDSDAGFSLAELLVAMVIMSILGALTAKLFVSVDNSSAMSTDRSINSASAGAVMQAWTEYLRVADGLTPGSTTNRIEWLTAPDQNGLGANEMVFYADLFNRTTTGSGLSATNAPTMIWLRLDGKGVLIEEQFSSTAVQGASPTRCRRLLSGVTTTRLFTPYDASGHDLSTQNLGTASGAGNGCQNLPVTVPSQQRHPDATAAANLPNVSRISIDFVVPDSRKKHAIEFNSVVTLPTLGGSI
jgi:prepilin-type N-terminal cleavage/methylation domain-containing protein